MAARHDAPPTPQTIRPNFDLIPTELQRLNQWVLWRWERRADKFTKLPFTRGGHHAKSNDPRTWTDFDGVRIAYGGLNFSGVGLCLSADDGLTGIDLDHVVDRETGSIVNPEAAEIVGRFAGTYAEKSPSGDGLRIWCYGKAPRSGKAPGRKWCEVYTHPSHRYLTVTGAQWPGSADVVSDQQEGLDWLHATLMKKPDRKEGIAPPAIPAPVPCDQGILELIRQSKQGTAFERLYGGDAGADHSAADLGLCNVLAFWCGRDPEQMDRLFRSSGLMRPKWDQRHASDGRTYGQVTIHKAIEDCREVYKPRGTGNAYGLRPKAAAGDPGIHSGVVESKAYAPVADLDDARTRKEFESQIDATTDFDELIRIASRVKESTIGEPHRERLAKLISRKANVGIDATRSLMGIAVSAANRDGRPDDGATERPSIFIPELNEKHAVVPIGGRVHILNRDYDPGLRRPLLTFSAPADFKLRYQPRKLHHLGELVDIGTYWLDSPGRRQYEGVTFAPGRSDTGAYLNLWTGWGVTPKRGDCEIFLDFLLKVICGGNPNLFVYVEDWLCHLFQKPAELPGTGIALRGKQGVGKNTLVETIGALVGAAHYVELSSIQQVAGRFTGHLADSLLVFANEAIWGGDKASEGVLKAMVTDPTQPMERKGKDIVMVPNFKRLILASNEDWIVPRGMTDRRWLVIDVGDQHAEDQKYFGAIRAWRKHGLPALLHHFITRDIRSFVPRKIPDALVSNGWELKIRSADTVTRWWHDVLCYGELDATDQPAPWPAQIKCEELQGSYTSWCARHRAMHVESITLFGTRLREFGFRRAKVAIDGQRPWHYLVPPLGAAREAFSKVSGRPAGSWDDDDS